MVCIFAQKFAKDLLFKNNDSLRYVDGEITENKDNDVPVVSTGSSIVRPYLDNSVSIAKTFL